MVNYFPLPESLVESEAFARLSPIERLYLVSVISEASLRGTDFYKADIEFAAFLGCAEITIRKARRKVTSLGWVVASPGQLARNRKLATTYLAVPCAQAVEGVFFAQVHRHAFEVLVRYVRNRWSGFKHVDVVVYLVLAYFRWRFRGAHDDQRFFVPKEPLRVLVGCPGVVESVERLYKGFTFKNGAHLFEYTNHYHKLIFRDWKMFADPSENDDTRKIFEQMRAEVDGRAAKMRKPKTKLRAKNSGTRK